MEKGTRQGEYVLDPKSWAQSDVVSSKPLLAGLLYWPLLFKLNGSEIPQRGMNALVHIDLIEKPPQLSDDISVILILGQVNFLLFDRAHESLRIAILPVRGVQFKTNEKREARMRIHRDVEPHTKEEAEVAFAQGTREQIRDALLGVAYYEEDWRWVQSACLAFLDSSDTYLQGLAITCLAHLAMFHKTLDLAIVLPALQAHISDPKLAPAFYDALGDIASQVEDTSYFVENWDELPQRIMKVLIGEGIFDRGGKRIKKRNFVPIRKSETLGQVSRDRELVERLKQQCTASSSYDWKEYYDEQGRLLRLNLADLGLVQLPAELWQFTSLQELDLGENPLSSLPAELGQLINLEWLGLSQNPQLQIPPPEVVQQGIPAVLAYLRALP